MIEEPRTIDPTRRLLKVFGVKVTDYEERTGKLLQQAADQISPDEMLRLAAEAIELTADLNRQLREMTAYVLDMQTGVLASVRGAIDRAQGHS